MGKLLESTDWGMRAYKGLVFSAWLGTTLKSIGWPRMSLGYSRCLSLPASPSVPSLTQVSTTFLINILHGTYIAEPPFKGPQPLSHIALPPQPGLSPKGTRDDKHNGHIQCWIQLSCDFQAPWVKDKKRKTQMVLFGDCTMTTATSFWCTQRVSALFTRSSSV